MILAVVALTVVESEPKKDFEQDEHSIEVVVEYAMRRISKKN